jgi:hypothetical protein
MIVTNFPKSDEFSNWPQFRFGSEADICAAQSDVRFASNSDRESDGVMSALPPKADMCSAQAHVRFGPIADISQCIARSVFSAKAFD